VLAASEQAGVSKPATLLGKQANSRRVRQSPDSG
jgi:hypothetical protein